MDHFESLPVIKYELMGEDVILPTQATLQSVGYDLRAFITGRVIKLWTPNNESVETSCLKCDHVTIPSGYRALIPTGFKAQMPMDIEAQLRMRSSTAIKKGLIMPNAPATIDPDYPDEWFIAVANISSVGVKIEHQERIAQIVFNKVQDVLFFGGTVGVTTDRQGGVGSSG